MVKLDKVLRLSGHLICTLDIHGRFIYISDSSLEILGYTPSELCGKHYSEFIDCSDASEADEKFIQVDKTGIAQINNRYAHKNGHFVHLYWSAQWDDEDQVFYTIGKSETITAREEAMKNSLEASHQRYKYVTKATFDAIWDWDIISGTLYWGENFEHIFGYVRKYISPRIDSWTACIFPEDSARILTSLQTVLRSSETNWKEEYRYKRGDGTYADVVNRGFVIRDKAGIAIRMVGAMHDISDMKQALQEMNRITDDLYKRNRELHEFGYIVSHNLRSPVANIMGITEVLEIEKDDPEAVSSCTSKLKVSISRLDEVIIDLSKILNATDSIELTIEPVDLSETVRNVQTDISDKILRNKVRIDLTTETVIVYAHKAYIYSVLFNLITNSIKYRSDEAPIISINISTIGNTICIIYTDNGCGIDLGRYGGELFKPYKRFHATVEGKGLGLFLVKSHLDALGGKIAVDSKPGSGTTFTIFLPKGSAANEG